jgi:tetratricopeptide (TPR) repeat protein
MNLNSVDEKNIYFYKIFKMRLAFLEKLEKNNIFIDELKKFTNRFPSEFEMRRILGDKYRKLKNYEKAIVVYSRLIENEKLKGTSNILYSRGISYEQIKDWKRAEQDFKRSLDLNPNDPYVMNYLAYSWLDRKININRALELLKKAVDLQPSDGFIRDSLGWAYFLSKKFEESVFHLEKAVVMLPNDATLNDHLGDAYWMSNRKSEALSQWKKVLILDPEYKTKKVVNEKINKGL